MDKTKSVGAKNIKVKWHLIDARGRVLGRLASEVAQILMGKHKPYYSYNLNCGDKVVVINASKIRVTGGKEKKKVYYRHTGYPGGLRQETLESLMLRRPTEAIRRAVWGMLPVNKLRKRRIKNLYIYADEKHPYTANIKAKD